MSSQLPFEFRHNFNISQKFDGSYVCLFAAVKISLLSHHGTYPVQVACLCLKLLLHWFSLRSCVYHYNLRNILLHY